MNIQKLIFILCNFTLVHIYCAQSQKENFQQMRKNMIKQTMQDYSFLTKTFDFLHKMNNQNQLFYNFLQQNLSYDENHEEPNFGNVIEAAENYIIAQMNNDASIILNHLLQCTKSKDCLNDHVYTYFMQNKDYPIVRQFLQQLSARMNKDFYYLLNMLIMDNNIYMIKLFIGVELNFNCQDYRGFYPLDYAIMYRRKEIAQMLINAGADIHSRDAYGQTPLHTAVKFYNKPLVLMLMNAGADVNVKDNYQDTPLHYASRYDLEEIARILVTAGADIHIQNDRHQTPESISCSRKMRAILNKEEMICCSIS